MRLSLKSRKFTKTYYLAPVFPLA